MRVEQVDLAEYSRVLEQRKNSSHLLIGGDGICIVMGNEIIKYYFNPIETKFIFDMSEINSPKIAFPKRYLVLNNLCYGEKMPYYTAKVVSDSLGLNSMINPLIGHYYRIMNEIARFPGIFMEDIETAENVLYSEEEGFFLIDTFLWHMRSGNNASLNMSLFDEMLIKLFFQVIGISVEEEIKSIEQEYSGIKSTSDGKDFLNELRAYLPNIKRQNICLTYSRSFSELLTLYRWIIMQIYDKEVSTIGEISNYSKRLKQKKYL